MQPKPLRTPSHGGASLEFKTKLNKSIKQPSSARATKRSATFTESPGTRERVGSDCRGRESLDELLRRTGPSLPAVEVFDQEGVTQIRFSHHDQAFAGLELAHALGTTDAALLRGILHQLADASRLGGDVEAGRIDFGLSVLRGAKPQDPIELMLVTQMQAVHVAAMTSAKRLAGSTTVQAQDSNAACMNKCMRTFATQVEALKRHRSTADQKVVVQHQHVAISSQQAVVGIRQGRGDE